MCVSCVSCVFGVCDCLSPSVASCCAVQWKYLEMPYLEVPINKRVFLNGERARTWNSALKGIPVRVLHQSTYCVDTHAPIMC